MKRFLNFKTIFSILFILSGIILLLLSNYISNEVAKGRQEISSAEQSIKGAKGLFSFVPPAKPVGDALTDSAQKKIEAGSEKANRYEKIANMLLVGGYVLIGLGIFILSLKIYRKLRH